MYLVQKIWTKGKGRLFFRDRDNKEGFPIMFTTKRNVTALKEEGLSERCIVPGVYFRKSVMSETQDEK